MIDPRDELWRTSGKLHLLEQLRHTGACLTCTPAGYLLTVDGVLHLANASAEQVLAYLDITTSEGEP